MKKENIIFLQIIVIILLMIILNMFFIKKFQFGMDRLGQMPSLTFETEKSGFEPKTLSLRGFS